MMNLFFKLCKIELKHTWRRFMPLYVVLILYSFFMCLDGFYSFVEDEEAFRFMLNIFSVLSLVLIITSTMVTFFAIVSIINNFIRSMFGREAYLTHTLPVSSIQLMLSKLVIAVFWIAISYVSSELVVRAFFGTGLIFNGEINFGYSTSEVWRISSLCNISVLQLFFVITLVHSCYFHKNRFIIGVIIYFLIKYVETRIWAFLLNFSFLSSYFVQAILAIGLFGLYFFATCYLLDHKLEVE